ncbi:MAG: hypothetical protein LUE20_08670 [Oscillospiraceae bacterium]|nr:hypothetical protein [Oscillospiraceae bacterium]
MRKRFGCILIALVMVFCLSSGSFSDVNVFADEENYTEISSSSKVLTTGKYKLSSNVTLKNFLQIDSGEEVTLDLNGYELSVSGTRVIIVKGGTLNLIDSSEGKTGKVTNTSTSTSTHAIGISTNGTLNMNGGTVSGAYGIYTTDSSSIATINITAGTVKSTKRAAVYCYKGSVDISGTDCVEITADSSDSQAYGIHTVSATITISNPNTYVSTNSSSSYPVYKQSSSNVSITAGHYSADVTSYVSEGYSCNKTDDTDYPYVVTADVEEPEVVLPVLYGETLTLDGTLGVTFYFSMTDVESPANYTLSAKIGDDGEEQIIYASESKILSNGVEYYRYTVYVKPNEFLTTIYASLTDCENSTDTYEYSVYDYCLNAIENEWEESELCKALLNYGDYASAYDPGISQYSFEDIGDWTDPVAEAWDVDLSEYDGTETTGVAKTILLGNTVAIRLYLTSEAASEDDVFTVDGTTLELHSVDDKNYSYYIEFKVPAKDMDTTFTVLKNGVEFTTYSVLSYVKNIVETEDDTALANLCKAIYYYSLEASKYTGWQ